MWNQVQFTYIEDITRWLEDMNFMFEWQEQYLRSERIFRRFPKILQNLSKGHTNVAEHFQKISEGTRRLPKIAKDFRGRPEDVSIIHQRIEVQFKRQT